MEDSTRTPTKEKATVSNILSIDSSAIHYSSWKGALITKEDSLHHHKILGTLCFGSILFRFASVFNASDASLSARINASDMGFLSHPQLSWLTLALHAALPISSFQFRIPTRRIKDGGRIWPEYRLHAAVFSLRSLILIALYQLERQHSWSPNFTFNYFILIGGMVAADVASWSVGKPFQSQSVRGLDTHPAVKFFFSFMQFNTSAGLVRSMISTSFSVGSFASFWTTEKL